MNAKLTHRIVPTRKYISRGWNDDNADYKTRKLKEVVQGDPKLGVFQTSKNCLI